MPELFYDGDCSFCRRSIALLKRFDVDDAIAVSDSNDSQTRRDLYLRTGKNPDLDSAMWALDEGTLYEGYDAFRAAMLRIPKLRVLAQAMGFPMLRFIGRPVYRLIAANRRRIGCGSHCSIS